MLDDILQNISYDEIPICIRKLNNKCYEEYVNTINTIQIKYYIKNIENYNLTDIEKNIKKINNIFYLIKKGANNKTGILSDINNIINFLNENDKNILKDSIKKLYIQTEKKCDTFNILSKILKIYEYIYDKSKDNLKSLVNKSIDNKKYEINKIIYEIEKDELELKNNKNKLNLLKKIEENKNKLNLLKDDLTYDEYYKKILEIEDRNNYNCFNNYDFDKCYDDIKKTCIKN